MHHLLTVIALTAGTTAALAAPPLPTRSSNPHSALRNPQSQPTSLLSTHLTPLLPAPLTLLQAGKLKEAQSQADANLSLLATYGTDRDADAFLQAAFTRRLVASFKDVDPATTKDLLPYLLQNDPLAKALVFSLPSPGKAKTAYPLLARLVKERRAAVDRLPNLAAAIALVHDTPLEKHINENTVAAADPVAIFDYFATNEARMSFGLRNIPVDLLVYVVDTTSSIKDLNWALRSYAGNRNVGALFFNVRYDDNAFGLRTQKEVSKQGYTLQNILELGGVCADQAHFTTEVAKAIGVPSAYTRGSSVDSSHAWVGFLQTDPRGRAAWNFDNGRYEVYRNTRGDVTDPVTRDSLPDSYVSLLASSLSTPPAARQTATAFLDAAQLLTTPATSTASPPRPSATPSARTNPAPSVRTSAAPSARAAGVSPASPSSPSSTLHPPSSPSLPPELASSLKARPANVTSALELIEFGLRRCETYPAAWTAVASLSPQMTLDQKRRWADLVQKLCLADYPDFALATLEPMIQSVAEIPAQARMWDALYANFHLRRPDLAAEVRLRQGEMYEKANNPVAAGRAYEDVIRTFVNTSPHALAAVMKAEALLKRMNQPQAVLALYQRAADSVVPPANPGASVFMRQSNWYKLKSAYARKLQEAGRTDDARTVLADIGATGGDTQP